MEPITVETIVHVPVEKAWELWNMPEHITQWAFASDDWTAPSATNDLSVGGKFVTRMESVDKSEGFDFGGTYTAVEEYAKIEYVIEDGRTVKVEFMPVEEGTKIAETFDPEHINPAEMQKSGWQAILDNFKKYAEKE